MYDKSGNVKWANSYGDSGYDWGYDISTTPNGTIYMTGYYSSAAMNIDTITLTNVGNYDIWVAEFDSLGSVVRAQSIGGTEWDAGIDVTSDDKGNAYLAGGVGSNSITLDTINLSLCSSSDMFIAKWETVFSDDIIDDTSSSEILDHNDSHQIILFPNPCEGKLFFSGLQDSKTKIELFTSLGNFVLCKEIKLEEDFIDISHLSPGLYSVRLTSPNSKLFYSRFIRE
jgi:hypothetical protein